MPEAAYSSIMTVEETELANDVLACLHRVVDAGKQAITPSGVHAAFSILHLANTHLRVLDLAIRKRHEARVRPPWRNRI